MDEKSGFTLLQAAVFEEKYNIVLEASGLLDNFVEEMELTKLQLTSCHLEREQTHFILLLTGFMKSWLRTRAD